MTREVVLCAGMHRSGTSLTASLLQGLGLAVPGELIAGDVANPSGYFENRSIVAAQEQLLQELGYWWPTERASRGMPAAVRAEPAYRRYVDWLTAYLAELFRTEASQLAVKDPRTSLLLPAWREAAERLALQLRVVICLRDPRDVCWSLVWRDGPSVGMSWGRAQRLWMEHYRALLNDLQGIPAAVVLYEAWLQPPQAQHQLQALAHFLALQPSTDQLQAGLQRVRPEFNHGGGPQLPQVHHSLRHLHRTLAQVPQVPAGWARQARRSAAALERHRLRQALHERCHLLWLRTPWGRRALGAALDPGTIKAQLGTASLRAYRRRYSLHPDLRPHPLISPAHLNQERERRGLPPFRSADELFRHLLYPDLIPLDPHPWFNSRHFQGETGSLGAAGPHPVLAYLGRSSLEQPSPYPDAGFPVPWLVALGAPSYPWNAETIPAFVSRLLPGLVLADPVAMFGEPSSGEEPLLAHEAYWREIAATFSLWPSGDALGPLQWIAEQSRMGELGITEQPLAVGMSCWWPEGHWEAPLLAGLAGADLSVAQCFATPDPMLSALRSRADGLPVLLALTEPVLELLLASEERLPAGVALLNLVWPRVELQSFWLHLLAKAELILECRPAVRAYLQGLGLPARWSELPSAAKRRGQRGWPERRPALLLATAASPAEACLAESVNRLDPSRYSAYLRLDAQMQCLGGSSPALLHWLDQRRRDHARWVWLNPPAIAGDPKAYAVLAWARRHGPALQVLTASSQASDAWLTALCR
jgi:hypothetical protein